MAIFHCSVGNAKSAAGADAYIEGEKRTDKSNGNYYNYESRTDVKFSETALAKNAPDEWKDSAKLWEAAGLAEQPGGRQAKKEEIALPSDWTLDKCVEVCRRRAEAITEKGHCVTWAIHDKGDGNIHAHFLRTVRAIDENGNFKKYKSKKEYLLDEQGNKIPQWEKVQLLDEKGEPVFNKGGKPVYAKDDKGEWIYKLDENGNKIQKLDDRNRKQWQSRMVEDLPTSGKDFVKNVRQEWETLLNEYLPENEKVSCKSLKEQGIDRLPTIHEGQGKRAQERKEQNELIKLYNKLTEKAKDLAQEIKDILKEPEKFYEIFTRTHKTTGKLEYNTDIPKSVEAEQKPADSETEKNEWIYSKIWVTEVEYEENYKPKIDKARERYEKKKEAERQAQEQVSELIDGVYKFADGQEKVYHRVCPGESFGRTLYTFQEMNNGAMCVTFEDKHGQQRVVDGELYDRFFGFRKYAVPGKQMTANYFRIEKDKERCQMLGGYEYEGRERSR